MAGGPSVALTSGETNQDPRGPVAVQSEKNDLVKTEDLALFGVSTESIALFNTPLSALFSSSRRTIHHPPPPVVTRIWVPISGLGGFSA